MLKDHISGVAERCLSYAPQGWSASCQLLGTLHDMGKYSSSWQSYLAMDDRKRKIPHSPYGAYDLTQLVVQDQSVSQFLFMDVLAQVISSHHGLRDALTLNGDAAIKGNRERFLQTYGADYQEIRGLFYADFDEKQMKQMAQSSQDEFLQFYRCVKQKEKECRTPWAFTAGCLTRILLSVLIDSDWSDAASFFSQTEEKWQKIRDSFSWKPMIESLERELAGFTKETEINKIRALISEECKIASSRETGIYRLNVPTGGGKTLSVMMFALHHAQEYGKERIIYTAPFKSIIDQTAKEYRKKLLAGICADDQRWLLTEHHGDVIHDMQSDSAEDNEMYQFLIDTWSSPVVLTTLVQLLNTLFSDNKASIRRLHTLCNSVLIIDEYQAMPKTCVTIANTFFNVLSAYFNTTVVLCTATQPPFQAEIQNDHNRYKVEKINYAEAADLVDDFSNEKCFQRTQVVFVNPERPWLVNDLTDFIYQRISETDSVLTILNTRAAVQTLYAEVSRRYAGDENVRVVVLSNSMIPVHRKKQIQMIEDALAENAIGLTKQKLLVISTSLIEAGVNVSFGEVIRSLAGLDSIAQAAGRCNRHQESITRGKVWIVHLVREWENVDRMEDVKVAQEVSLAIHHHYNKYPDYYDEEIIGKKALDRYFIEYYSRLARKTHYMLRVNGVDCTLYDLLSSNQAGCTKYAYYSKKKNPGQALNQAFLTAGENFEAIQDDTVRLFVPWKKEGRELEVKLNTNTVIDHYFDLFKQVEQYSIGISQYLYQILKEKGAVCTILDGKINILLPTYYDDIQGLILEPNLMPGIINGKEIL
ncbi:MAG: CRISPR-associated helicase Cas3' [Saccharofermentanales bacterium]